MQSLSYGHDTGAKWLIVALLTFIQINHIYLFLEENSEGVKVTKIPTKPRSKEFFIELQDFVSLLTVDRWLFLFPKGYKKPKRYPTTRDKIWYNNVPHAKLAVVKRALPNISWGKHSRVVVDVGCGIASFGGFLFEKDVLTMSFAAKDEHEAQVQLALEWGIPTISVVMGTKRLPFPSVVFDIVHCARCRVPWHIGGVCRPQRARPSYQIFSPWTHTCCQDVLLLLWVTGKQKGWPYCTLDDRRP